MGRAEGTTDATGSCQHGNGWVLSFLWEALWVLSRKNLMTQKFKRLQMDNKEPQEARA